LKKDSKNEKALKEQILLLDRAIVKFGSKKKVAEKIGIYPQHFNRYYHAERLLPLDKFLFLRNILRRG
jgi:hypothetical protein